ncbi:MAG TPA: WYL domain-containing protein [Actinomycetota bacterium]|nr:WYL domain-containing protein [Actinomycetota bacterium]
MPAEGERRKRVSRASERLERLLAVVPYLVRHPGTELVELGRLFGVGEDELLEDLNRLFMSGLPPYGPGDLIGVEIDEGRVWIDMADYFSRPLRLTRVEALALYLRGTELAATPGLPESAPLSSALGKLRGSLGPDGLGDLGGRVEWTRSDGPDDTLQTLRRAAEGRERLSIEYYAASSAERTEREIDPEEVFFAIGNWYVAAFDHRSGQERLFRADRIRTVARTGVSFEPRGLEGAGRPLYTPTDRDLWIRLRLRPEARWVAEYYEVEDQRERGDGDLEVVLPSARLEWVARLVLRLSGQAVVLDPPELKDRVRELAERTRKRYERGSPHDV